MTPPPRWLLVLPCLWLGACGQSGHTAPTPVAVPPKLTTLDLLAGRPGGPGWVDGALVAAHFAKPWAIASDGQHRLFVADGNTIRAIDTAAAGGGAVTTLAGTYGRLGSADGVGAAAGFNEPSGLAYTAGKLYVADSENDTIRAIDPQSGAVTTIAGAPGQEETVDATGLDARFRVPQGIAAGADGNLYIADTEADIIRKLDLQSGAVTTLAGTAGSSGTADGVGAAASFYGPTAMVIDGAGVLYVLDSLNHSVRRVDTATSAVSTVATFAALPQGIALDGGDVLVALGDVVLGDNRVVRVAADGTVTTLAGSASQPGFVDGTGAAARFDSPAGLWNDGAGTLYVADDANYVVRAVSLAGSPDVRTFAGARSDGYADGVGAAARFSASSQVLAGVAADGESAYLADTGNDVIRQITLASGAVTTLAGAPGQAGRQDGALTAARFDHPQGVALDADARQLYVADTGNRAVRRIDLGAAKVSTLVLTPPPGQTFGGFDAPSGVVLDGGRLYVTDRTNQVVVAVDPRTSEASVLAGQYGVAGTVDGVGTAAAFYAPLGIGADGHGHLFVADSINYTIRRIDVASGTVSTLAGHAGTSGSSDGVGADARLTQPLGIAADTFGDVFVSDLLNDTVRHVDEAGAVTTVLGVTGVAGVRLGPLPAQLSAPTSLALTPAGGLLVVSENALLIAH